MSISRREWLQRSAAVAALAWPGVSAVPWLRGGGDRVVILDPDIKALAMRGLDAARAAGASYADLRITRRRARMLRSGPLFMLVENPVELSEDESIGFGIRALVNGYWGFASSNVLEPDEAARLGREAATLAKANSLGKVRTVEFGTVPPASGHWVTPVEIDPFTVPLDEILDFTASLNHFVRDRRASRTGMRWLQLQREERAFASTEGAFATQLLYRSGGSFGAGFALEPPVPRRRGEPQMGAEWSGNMLTLAGRGWEYVSRAPIQEELRRLRMEAEAIFRLPMIPVELGRYDVAFDAASTARLLETTLAGATEADRAFGFEANASGTSFLNDPVAMIGTQQVGAPMLTINANRSLAGGLATVKWDDEGVAPEDFTLVRDGILTDYQTTRESAGWLKDGYARLGKPVRSHGCSASASGLDAPLSQVPNLRIVPGKQSLSFDDLVSQLGNGIAATGIGARSDYQGLTGLAGPWNDGGALLKITRGKPVARINPEQAAFLYRTVDLWKSMIALGGEASVMPISCERYKGEPAQSIMTTIEAPPMVTKQLTVIDPTRTA